MKRHCLLALAIVLFAGVANAQLRYGIKDGANLSDVLNSSKLLDQSSMRAHYQVGLVAQYRMGIFAIQPELIYTEKGSTFSDVYPVSSYLSQDAGLNAQNPGIALTTQSLEIPINLQLGLKIAKTRVFVQGGPYLGLLLGGRINGDADAFKNVNDRFAFNPFEFGLGAGAGVEYQKFQFSAKYDFGMSRLGKETLNTISGANMNPFYNMRNRNINVSLAYLF